jgi:hypothetical protein
LARNYGRLAGTSVGMQFIALTMLMAHHFVTLMAENA